MKYAFKLAINADLSLVSPSIYTAEAIYQALDNDREHLRTYLDFVDKTTSIEDEEAYIKMKLSGEINGTDRLFFIAYQEKIVGSIDFHFMDLNNQTAEIGYWVASQYCGKNIATDTVQTLCKIAFDEMGLNRLTIVADVENKPSNRVAVKCGFKKEGTFRQSKKVYNELRDFNMYALLKEEF
ncbi:MULTISPECIES: GNAT family N-acetyltransferase [Listeria]|uniref:GNAT family N-acetyltransferase n=1 Tax=Listeria TaxID=1637 RepID=UPI000B5902B1|nr:MULTISPECIES: GNAT family protein [Listeria]